MEAKVKEVLKIEKNELFVVCFAQLFQPQYFHCRKKHIVDKKGDNKRDRISSVQVSIRQNKQGENQQLQKVNDHVSIGKTADFLLHTFGREVKCCPGKKKQENQNIGIGSGYVDGRKQQAKYKGKQPENQGESSQP